MDSDQASANVDCSDLSSDSESFYSAHDSEFGLRVPESGSETVQQTTIPDSVSEACTDSERIITLEFETQMAKLRMEFDVLKKDVFKATGLSPDESIELEEAWKELFSQGAAGSESDLFQPGRFIQVDPRIISSECGSTSPNGKVLVYVRESFKELFKSIMSVHNAPRAQSTASDHDFTAATDQTSQVSATENPATTTTAAAIQQPSLIITGASSKTPPITGPGNKYLVTGTPGTGKSYFAYFLLPHLLAKEGDSVLYQNCHKDMEFFVVIRRSKDSEFVINHYQMPNNGIPKSNLGFLGKGKVSDSDKKPVSWYIFDSGHKSAAKPEITDVPTIVIASPDFAQYKDFMLKCPEKFYMPTWEWPEIEAVIQQPLRPGKSDEHSQACSKRFPRAHEAFLKHGGVIREVLSPYSEARLTELHERVDRSNVEMVLQFLQARGDVSSAVSHRILHQKCDKKLETGLVDYQNPSIGFASDYVFDRFWAEHLEKKADLTLEQLSRMYELVPAAKGLRRSKFGNKFEELVHRTLVNGSHNGKVLNSRGKEPKSKPIKLTFDSKVERQSTYEKIGSSIVCTITTKDADNTAYVFPSSKTFPAIDAFLPGQQYVLQMTIAKKHPVAVPELFAFIASRGWALKDVTLVFVVLDQIYEHFEYQHQIEYPAFKQVHQYVLPMPPHH